MKKNKIKTLLITLAAAAFLTYASFVNTTAVNITAANLNESAEAVPSSEMKKISLTFDDGPHPKYTSEVLDVLKEKGVRATFFTVGYRAETLPHLILKARNQGCGIGNHTYNHKDLTKMSDADVVSDLEKCSEIIKSITGSYPTVYRPPFGNINKAKETCISTKGIEMKKVMWDIDSADWRTKDVNTVVRNVCRDAKDGDIILMHDFYPQTVKALPLIIDKLREKGFEFVIFEEDE